MPAPSQTTLHKQRVAPQDAGQRLDRWLKNTFPEVPYVALQKMLRQGKVRVNGSKITPAYRLEEDDVVALPLAAAPLPRGGPAPAAYSPTSADRDMIKKCTVFEDKWILAINKPQGLPSQAGGTGNTRSLDRIVAPFKLVHRLDKETTGLLVIAKNRTTAAALSAQFSGRSMQKTYIAAIVGPLAAQKGEIKAPILKSGAFAKIDEKGDPARTTWRRLATLKTQGELDIHLVECTPHTGRMNQLRVHFAHLGTPILGDDKYGNNALKNLGKTLHPTGKIPLYLHAKTLVFRHPQTEGILELHAPLPPHVATLAVRMGWQP